MVNRDSRKPGKGAKPAKRKRIIRGKAEEVPKLAAAPEPSTLPLSEAAPVLTREQLRELALDELARHAVDAARAIGQSSKQVGKRERGAGQRESAQKWLLQTLFDQTEPGPGSAVPPEQEGSEGGSLDNVYSLAEQRRELANITRQQRRDMNK
jgi:hypothetical protein